MAKSEVAKRSFSHWSSLVKTEDCWVAIGKSGIETETETETEIMVWKGRKGAVQISWVLAERHSMERGSRSAEALGAKGGREGS